jgi:hypothetical protein
MSENVIKLNEKLGMTPTKEPDFIKLYFDDIRKLWEISKPAQIILGELLKLVTYNPTDKMHNMVVLPTHIKQEIKNLLSDKPLIANNIFSRGIASLLKSSLLIKVNTDVYYLSHFLCSRTDWSNTEAMRAIRIEILYTSGCKTLNTYVDNNLEDAKEMINYRRENFKDK